MPEGTTRTPNDGGDNAPQGGTGTQPHDPPASGGATLPQDVVNKMVGTARVEARTALLKKLGVESEDDLKARLEKAAELEKAQLTEVERANQERDEAIAAAKAAAQEAEALKLNLLRARIGREKGLPELLIDKLKSTDEEGITAEVEELLPLIKSDDGFNLGGGTNPPGAGGTASADEKMTRLLLKSLRGG